ncbi:MULTISPECIES: TrlF family AAA-like ATPase [unclassified Acinetobacter]|uniref:TrlF family AAA-like ATPase n=1 Tax=unclassified Acinetobacter TaxID=196816 RepID=UPI0015D3DE7C|nr:MULTISPECIES: hypothetical protein [unclassified Acinetobacter]
MSRGSEWGRWDLHVHTKGTAKNDKFGDISLEKYCIQLFKKALERNIKAIGITDYFSIDNYKEVKKFQDEIYSCTEFNKEDKDLISKIFVMPNMELRITPSTDKGSAINMHLLLNPKIIEDFENLYCHALTFIVSDDEQYKLTPYDLKRLGRKGSSQTISDDSAYRSGISSFVLNSSEIINAFKKYPDFRKNCLVAVANSNKDGASAFQGHEKFLNSQDGATLRILRESLYKVSEVIFSSTLTDKPFFLGKKTEDQQSFLDSYGSYKPCIHGSDAHDLNTLFEPTDQKYCWIKAEPTFEGLKQIIHEPESRVHIGQRCPEIKNNYEVIDYIELNSNDVLNERIYFNSNLTSIIGGRSSGKSTLLQCLANKLRPTLFSENKIDKPKHLDPLCLNFNIKWKDGESDNSRPVEYFYQGHMFKKSTEEGIEDIVKSLILQKKPKIFENFQGNIDTIRHENSGLLSKYFSIRNTLISNNEALIQKGNPQDIEKQILLLNEELKSNQTTESISESDIITHETLTDELHSIENNLEKIQSLKKRIALIELAEFFILNNPLTIYNAFPTIENEFNEFTKAVHLRASEELINFKNSSTSNLNQQIKTIEDRKNIITNDKIFLKVNNHLKVSQHLQPILERKKEEEAKLKEIRDIEEKITDTKKNLMELSTEIRKNWESMFHKFSELTSLINQVTISKDIKIQTSNIFDQNTFSEFIQKVINQSSDKAKAFSSKTIKSEQELLEHFDIIIQSVKNEEVRFKQGSSIETITKEFFDNTWFKVKYEVTYDGDNYNDMSQGKKAFVVLKMSLDCSESKCPIIIDQPEDDLDNRAIYTELVTYLKEKKKTRQIILVTHNANVVVNADSELVIIANQHGTHSTNLDNKKFQYKFGSIESLEHNPECTTTLNQKTIKSHICEILEGGDRAFKLREQKYNLA